MAYGFQNDENAEQLAYARVEGVDASYRDLCNVCSNIRGRRADKAIEYLSEALEKKRPIRYFRHNKKRGHLHELGGRKGGYPVKSIKIVLGVLTNAVANSQAKGLADCKIVHACANKQLVYARMSPSGRRIRQDFETAFVEIVLRELQTEDNIKKKQQIQAARQEAIRKAEEAAKKVAEKAVADSAKKDEASKQPKKQEASEAAKEGEKSAKPEEKKVEPKAESKKPEEKKAEPKAESKKPEEKKAEPKAESKKPEEKKAEPKTEKSDAKAAHKKMSEVLAEQKKSEGNSKPDIKNTEPKD
ncbi:MAG: 50S ribosomal protein L22 [Candidatus Micrarchaeota archaeon]